MEIQETAQGAVTVLKPVGALTAGDAGDFKIRALGVAEKTLGRIVVDASGVPFVDSLGLEGLVDVTEQLAQGGRALKLCSANNTIREVIQITGWGDSFEFYDDVNEGVRSFL
jgi:anti-sigma B factor antagonist